MRLCPDDWLRVVGVGGAGAIWGLGLARLVAEASFWPLLYGSFPAVAGVAIVCAAIVIILWLWTAHLPHPHTPTPPHPHAPTLSSPSNSPLAPPTSLAARLN